MSNATCWSERYKANRRSRLHWDNTATPAVRTPHQCPQCAQLLIHLQFFLNIAQTRNWGKKISSNWLVLNNTIEYSTYCCSLTKFWLEVCRRAGFCFVFSKKTREIKWSACVTAPLWRVLRLLKAREFEERGDRIDFKCGKLKNFQSRVPPTRNVIKYE